MSSIAQRQVLIGKQSVANTGVNVTTALRAVGNLKAVPKKVVVKEDIGSYMPARHYIGSLRSEGGLEFDGYYEHVPIPVSMALGAGYISGSSPKLWTFDVPQNTPPTIALYSMEYTDGNNHIVRGVDVFATELEISGEAEGSWMFKPKLMGGQTTFPAAVTASPTAPAVITPILMADTIIYMDTTFETMGGTPMTELISFTWKLSGLQHQKAFSGSLWPKGFGNNTVQIELEVVLEASNSVAEAVKDRLLTIAQTAIRVAATDASGTSQTAVIDGIYMLDDVDTLDERDGNNTLKFKFKGERPTSYWYSGESGASLQFLSTLTALP